MAEEESTTGWLFAGGTDAGEIADRYDNWATEYDADIRSWSYDAPEVVAGIVADRLPETASILDAGCGTGLVGTALREAGTTGEIVGIDVSAVSLDIAARTGCYSSVAIGDLQHALEFPDDRFDALVCVGVMTYVLDVGAAWREFTRVVRPGGLIVVTQREDLWEARQSPDVIATLTAEGVWNADVDGPASYLPGNPEGMSGVGVYYVTAVVANG